MYRVCLIIALCFACQPLIAQTNLFKGRVLSQGAMPVPYAVLGIFASDTSRKAVLNKITSEDGTFVIPVDSLQGRYIIRITHVAMDTLQEEIMFPGAGKVFLMKERARQLQDVTVTRKLPLITRKIDKVVMNVEDNPVAIGKNTLNLLQMAPGVQILGYNISINGTWGASVYVNGVPVQLSGLALQNYMSGLRASDIRSIEIIAHPSAEYSAAGVGGIINILLKKPVQLGWNGYAGYDQSFGLGTYPTYNPYAALNFKDNKVQLSAKYNYTDQQDHMTMTQEREITGNGAQSSFTERVGKYKNHNAGFTGNYDITGKQRLGIYYNGSFSRDAEAMSSQTHLAYADHREDNANATGTFPNSSKVNYHNVGLNYNWTTDTLQSKLTVAADYTHNSNRSMSSTDSKTYDQEGQLLEDTLYHYFFPAISKIGTADIRYSKMYRSGTELKFGGKYSTVDINTDNTFEIFRNGAWDNDPLAAFNYRYKEQISAGFVQLAGKFRAVEYKIGLRGEYSDVRSTLKSIPQDSANQQRYFNVFPSVFLGKNLDQKGVHNVSLSYNRRISRPSFNVLNPYRYFIDNYSVTSGNPYLKPSFVDAVELGYTLDSKYYFGASWSHMSRQISRIIISDAEDVHTELTWRNIGSTTTYTVNISAPADIAKWWSTNNTLLLQYKRVEDPQFRIEKGTFVFQTYHSFTITPALSASLSGFYTPRTVYGNTVTGQYSNISIGLKQKLCKDKLIVGANIDDLFYRNNPAMTSYYDNTLIRRHPKFQTRVLSFSVVYNFSFGKSFQAVKMIKSNEDENSRLKK